MTNAFVYGAGVGKIKFHKGKKNIRSILVAMWALLCSVIQLDGGGQKCGRTNHRGKGQVIKHKVVHCVLVHAAKTKYQKVGGS